MGYMHYLLIQVLTLQVSTQCTVHQIHNPTILTRHVRIYVKYIISQLHVNVLLAHSLCMHGRKDDSSHLTVCLSVCLSQSVCLIICQSVCLSICLSVRLSVSLQTTDLTVG